MSKMKKLVGMVCLFMICFSVNVFATSTPFLSLDTAQDTITSKNAILHAKLDNQQKKLITNFEIYVYKDNVLVKSGAKPINSSEDKINIEFDLNKDLSLELLANTQYAYTIYARADSDVTESMYTQSFQFKTKDVDSETTTQIQETTTEIETTIAPPRPEKPTVVKIESTKNEKKKSVTIRYKRDKKAKKYQVQYSLSRKFNKTTIKSTKKNKYTIKKLIEGKTYYIRVRSIYGRKKGAWSKVKKIVIK